MTIPEIVTYTVWITVAITGYQADEGARLGCYPGIYSVEQGPWVALPIEWVLGGYVDCGDSLYAILPTGFAVEAHVMDTGCMLHWPEGKTGRPFVVDLPRVLYPALEYPTTGKGELAIYSRDRNGWLVMSDLPLVAWATDHCDGPLSVTSPEEDARRFKQYHRQIEEAKDAERIG